MVFFKHFENKKRVRIIMSNEEMEFDEPKVTMTLDDGTELECDVVAIFPVGDQEYIALLPDKVVEGFEENEVFLYRYKELDGDDIELTQIEDEEEYEAAADAFDELLDEEMFNEGEE